MIPQPQDRSTSRSWLWLAGALVFLPLMVSDRSLWIDEGQTASYASLPGIAEFGAKIRAGNAIGSLSEGLMPLSMFLAWVGGKILPATEVALRLPNLFYLAGGLLVAYRIGLRLRAPWLVLLLAAHPFTWYYADEARPYALQIALGCCLMWSCLEIAGSRGVSGRGWAALFATGLALWASSLVGIIPFLAAVLVLVVLWWRGRWRPGSRFYWALALAIPCYVALGVFFVGAVAAMRGGRVWEFGPGNLAYTLYETTGFQGMGPNRNELRQMIKGGDFSAGWIAVYLPGLAAVGLCWGMLCLGALRHARAVCTSRLGGVGLALVLTVCGFVLLGLLARFAFWGRHLAPAMIGVVATACLLGQGWRNGRFLLAALAGLWLASSLNLRFNDRFAKEDYRGAADLAKQALGRGESIWWVADYSTAVFYGLRPEVVVMHGRLQWMDKNPATLYPKSVFLFNPRGDVLDPLLKPRWVFLSKPDVFDGARFLRRSLEDGRYHVVRTLPAFEVWSR